MNKSNQINIESYNSSAEEYHKLVSNFEILPQLNEFIRRLNDGDTILDLGCGPGHHSRFFRDSGFDVTGIDFSREMIKIALREVSNVDFEVMDILNLKFNSESFDGIWASASLLHISKKDIPSVLREIWAILKQNGQFYLSLKQGKGERLLKDTRYGGIYKYYSFFTVDEIVDYLEEAGFRVLHLSETEMREYYDTNPWLHIFCEKN